MVCFYVDQTWRAILMMKTVFSFSAIMLVAAPTIALANHEAEVKNAFKMANDSMMQGMMVPMSGDADKDFVMMMIPHHQGAIDMAKIELKYGKDPTLRTMAEGIIKAQEAEIAEMKKWQAANP